VHEPALRVLPGHGCRLSCAAPEWVSNKGEETPQWECGACGSKHTARLGTPMYQLKTASERVKRATHLAMLGMNIAAISEVLGHSQETVTAGWNGVASTATSCMSGSSRTWCGAHSTG